ncbi:hypothetical protein [Labilibaculum manganireducens]|nr:hypothetical protein [Labilibaculum manganireducens]
MKNKTEITKERSFKGRLRKWINRADTRDRSLDSKIRIRKWILILGVLFVLFAASFFQNPVIDLSQNSFAPGGMETTENEAVIPSFEMPVDSFELYLKQHIHENLSEKE